MLQRKPGWGFSPIATNNIKDIWHNINISIPLNQIDSLTKDHILLKENPAFKTEILSAKLFDYMIYSTVLSLVKVSISLQYFC